VKYLPETCELNSHDGGVDIADPVTTPEPSSDNTSFKSPVTTVKFIPPENVPVIGIPGGGGGGGGFPELLLELPHPARTKSKQRKRIFIVASFFQF
jgi:hypothetical protein